MAILVIAALVILGPERLPGAMSWVAKSLKQVREYATGAQKQFKDELGPEFDDLKKPFDELRGMRGMTPRGVITKHLFDGDDSLFTGDFDTKPTSANPAGLTPQAPGPSVPLPSPQNPSQPSGSSRTPGEDAPDPPPTPRYDTEAT